MMTSGHVTPLISLVLIVGVATTVYLSTRGASPLSETWRTRAIVRVVAFDSSSGVAWVPVRLEKLAGQPFKLDEQTMTGNELSSLVGRASHWTPDGHGRLENAFQTPLAQGHHLLVYRADVRMIEDDVLLAFTPVVLLTPDSIFNRPPPRRYRTGSPRK